MAKNNQSGYKGVYRRHLRYTAEIKISGKKVRLGTFATAEEAHGHYCEAASLLHGEFANFG